MDTQLWSELERYLRARAADVADEVLVFLRAAAPQVDGAQHAEALRRLTEMFASADDSMLPHIDVAPLSPPTNTIILTWNGAKYYAELRIRPDCQTWWFWLRDEPAPGALASGLMASGLIAPGEAIPASMIAAARQVDVESEAP